MRRRRVSILSADLSGNAVGRAYILAKMLQAEFNVHIVAFGQRDEIWPPIRSDVTIEYRRFYGHSSLEFWLNATRTVRRLIDGDVILAVKPLQQSFGLGLLARRVLCKPLILDIDDWEIGFLVGSLYWECRLHRLDWLASPSSPLFTRLLDLLIHAADAVTVSNGFLQSRYGGTWIPHARDERKFDGCQSSDAGGTTSKTVVFLGTARQNKGLHDLLAAWAMVEDADAKLRIVGTSLSSPIVRELLPFADTRTTFEEASSFEMMPAILASAGIAVIPQKLITGSIGQLPAKLIDAMAAGRAIIGTAVGDIPRWLDDGAGEVVPPDDPIALSRAISFLLKNPEKATSMGRQARARFKRFGSFAAVQPRLVKLVADLIARRPIAAPKPVFCDN